MFHYYNEVPLFPERFNLILIFINLFEFDLVVNWQFIIARTAISFSIKLFILFVYLHFFIFSFRFDLSLMKLSSHSSIIVIVV